MAREAGGAPAPIGLSVLLRLAGPVILARLGIMAMGLTDAIVVGRYSARELGYQALGWAPTAIILTMSVGLTSGVQVMTARYIGQGRPEAAGGVLRRGLVYSLWIGIASTAALILAGPPFLRAMGLSPDLAAGAGRALVVFALSLPPYLAAVAASQFLEALARPTPGMVAMWIANAVNLGLDLLLVPGAFGLAPLGAVGAAWSTCGARVVLAIMLLAYIATMKDARALGVFARPADGRAAAAEQRRIGYGAGVSYFFETAAFGGMNIIAGWLGALAVATYAVVLNVAAFVFMIPLGLATATAVLVARSHGADDARGVRRAAGLGFAACGVGTGVITAVVFVAARPIASAYVAEPEVLERATAALRLACLFLVADGLQVVAAQSLRARGDVWAPTAIHMASYGVMLPLGWALAHPAGLGVSGIVWAIIVSSLASASLLLGRFWLVRRES